MQYCVCGTEKCRGGLYLNSQRPSCFSALRQVISVSLPPSRGNLNDSTGTGSGHKLTELRVFGSGCDATRGSLWNPIPYPCINIVNYPNRNFTFQFFQKFNYLQFWELSIKNLNYSNVELEIYKPFRNNLLIRYYIDF